MIHPANLPLHCNHRKTRASPPRLAVTPVRHPLLARHYRCQTEIATIAFAMTLSAQWYRANADACARRADQACDPLAKAAYREMVRAWLILAITVEELVRQPLHETRGEEQVLAA